MLFSRGIAIFGVYRGYYENQENEITNKIGVQVNKCIIWTQKRRYFSFMSRKASRYSSVNR